jgi:hypothetical protein
MNNIQSHPSILLNFYLYLALLTPSPSHLILSTAFRASIPITDEIGGWETDAGAIVRDTLTLTHG